MNNSSCLIIERTLYNNTSEIFEILKKEDDETKNNTDQYKRISKQLDKLIELVSENNTQN